MTEKELIEYTSYDIIGDIHGYCDELVLLLEKMDYIYDASKGYYNNQRKAIFVGDLIDKGPKIRETLQLVKQMCDNDNAICIMGNHEYNGVNFWDFRKDKNGYYRSHTHVNILQHVKTIETFKNNFEEWEYYYKKWFSTLPIIFETKRFRVVHASYHPLLPKLMDQMSKLYSKDIDINNAILELGREREKCDWFIDGVNVSDIIESTLKGIEIVLPDGKSFKDNAGIIRTKSRVKWWINPTDNTYQNYLEDMTLEQVSVDNIMIKTENINPYYSAGYSDDDKIVFFGHYCLDVDGPPKPFTKNVCCLDYGISKKKSLVAYRYDGESQIDETKYVVIDCLHKF